MKKKKPANRDEVSADLYCLLCELAGGLIVQPDHRNRVGNIAARLISALFESPESEANGEPVQQEIPTEGTANV